MDEIAVQAAAASQQNGWNQEQAPVEGAAAQEEIGRASGRERVSINV